MLRVGKRLCLLILVLGAGCLTKDDHWQKSTPVTTTFDKLWASTRKVVSMDYRIDEERTDKAKRVLVTEWRERLHVYYLEGYRLKLRIEFEPFEGDKAKAEKDRRWVVKIRCTKEKNENVETPLSSEKAEWGEETHDISEEKKLVQMIIGEFRVYGASDTLTTYQPYRMRSSADGAWTETADLPGAWADIWNTAIGLARENGYPDEVLQPNAGRFESAWQPEGRDPEESLNRSRLILLVVPAKAQDGATVHRVQVRVEQQKRRTTDPNAPTSKWEPDSRSSTTEGMLAEKIESKLVR